MKENDASWESLANKCTYAENKLNLQHQNLEMKRSVITNIWWANMIIIIKTKYF